MTGTVRTVGILFAALAVRSQRTLDRWYTFEGFNIAQTEPAEVGDLKFPPLRDVAQRVATGITVICCVRHGSYPDAVKHNPDDAFKRLPQGIHLARVQGRALIISGFARLFRQAPLRTDPSVLLRVREPDA